MMSSIECPVCFTSYGNEVIPKLLKTCGHSLCCICLETELVVCPLCSTNFEENDTITNFSLLEVAENLSKSEQETKPAFKKLQSQKEELIAFKTSLKLDDVNLFAKKINKILTLKNESETDVIELSQKIEEFYKSFYQMSHDLQFFKGFYEKNVKSLSDISSNEVSLNIT